MHPLNRLRSRMAIIALLALAAIFLCIHLLPAQSFRITSVQLATNSLRVNWDAPGGSNYVLQASTNLAASNFVDLSPVIFIPGTGTLPTGYTHLGGITNSASRFYRVKAFPAPPTLQIYPTNAVIGLNMTNRYKVLLVNADNSSQDVTAAATLTILNNIAQPAGTDTNGFALVRGTNAGNGFVRAVYQGVTNTVNLSVAQLTGVYYVPALSTIHDYVKGQSTSVQVMGVFSNGKTNNITPSSYVDGGGTFATAVDYRVTADVANSFALITGQSAASGGELYFVAGGLQADSFFVTWCKFVSVSLSPSSAQVSIGSTQPFSAVGHVADGSSVNIQAFEVNNFTSSDPSIAQVNTSPLRASAVGYGTTSITIQVNNGAGCSDLFDSADFTVVGPPVITTSPADETATPGDDITFVVGASGTSPLTYQWQSNSVDILGATDSSLSFSNVDFSQQGLYQVIVSNSYGAKTSSVASLVVAPAADLLWSATYAGTGSSPDTASALAVDGGGRATVTGSSGYIPNIATIQYSPQGNALWTQLFNGTANSYDGAEAIAVDSNSNVFVTGYTYGSTEDFVTIKYSSAGVALWTNRYNGSGNGYDDAHVVAADGIGNVIVAGDSSGGSFDDFVTIKYSSAGTPLWTSGPGNGYNTPKAIALDVAGNVVVAGNAFTGYSYNFVTIKYSSAGVPVWTNRYVGPGGGYGSVAGVVVDSSGNVFVTGSSASAFGDNDITTIKYSSGGLPLWTNRFNFGPTNSNDTGEGIALDSSGNAFVVGASVVNGSYDYVTIKYSSATGLPLWTKHYNGPGNGSDFPASITVDRSDNIIVTGQSAGAGGLADCLTIKYSNTGTILWIGRYHSGVGAAVKTDLAGNVFVTGNTPDTNGYTDYLTLKYCAGPPVNDNFDNRIALNGSSIQFKANNECASKELDEPNHAASNPGGKSLWWTWTPTVSGSVTIGTCGSDFDTMLGVYTGNAVNALTLVINNDDSTCGVQSQVQFNAIAGTPYQIAVDGYKYGLEPVARSGNIVLSIQQ